MAYPTNDITTTNLDSPTDFVGAARSELYNALVRLGELIDSRNTASGLAPLDSNSQVPAANMPTTFTSGGSNNIIFNPATEVVVINDVIQVGTKTVTELDTTANTAGSIVYCSNGDGGDPCLAVGTGTTDTDGDYIWYRVALGTRVSAT